jgi:hypothetical protein
LLEALFHRGLGHHHVEPVPRRDELHEPEALLLDQVLFRLPQAREVDVAALPAIGCGARDRLAEADESETVRLARDRSSDAGALFQRQARVAVPEGFVGKRNLHFRDERVLGEPRMQVGEILGEQAERHVGRSNGRVVGPVQDLDEVGPDLGGQPRALYRGGDGLEIADHDRETLPAVLLRVLDELVKDVAIEKLEDELRVLRTASSIGGREGLLEVRPHRRPALGSTGGEKTDAASAVVGEDDVAGPEHPGREVVLERNELRPIRGNEVVDIAVEQVDARSAAHVARSELVRPCGSAFLEDARGTHAAQPSSAF